MSSDNEIEFMLDLLCQGDAKINLNSQIRDFVLVLGNTGAGKSTLIQWLKGNEKLVSREVAKNSAEFIITDAENRIGISTVSSQTLFPELVVDEKTNNVFYDCPGFSDTRSASHDIASGFFVQKVISHARRLKIILVVSYPSVRKGVNRIDFVELLTHVTELIKNFDKFQTSLVLVVTKVDNTFANNGDDLVLVPDEVVISNIQDFLTEVQEELKSRNRNLVGLLKTLKNKIGIFRRPNRAGPLIENETLESERKTLLTMIDRLHFSYKDDADFGFTISAESRVAVNDLITCVNSSIINEILKATKVFQEDLTTREGKFRKEQLRDEFKTTLENFANLEIIRESNDTENFFEQLQKLMGDTLNMSSIVNWVNYLKFLCKVGERPLPPNKIWINELSQVNEYLRSSENWYGFLVNLEEMLSGCELRQAAMKVVRVDKLENASLADLKRISGVGLENIKENEVSTVKLQALRKILSEILVDRTIISCETSDKLTARGEFVKFSDMVKKCRSKKITCIDVFATRRVFIDASFTGNGDVPQLNIVAPTWEIVGLQKINLDGKAGPALPTEKIKFAAVGAPGLPGGSAATFYGVGERFVNGVQLSISANGGVGGPGQNGGDGEVGKNGRNGSGNVGHNQISHGGPGAQGGKGGDGGKGGLGGTGAEVVILALGKQTNHGINVSNARGKTGIDGKGGLGGKGGKSGKDCHVTIKKKKILGFTYKKKKLMHSYETNIMAPDGEPGEDGVNATDQKQPQEYKVVQPFSKVIDDYKSFLAKSRSEDKEFLNLVDTHPLVVAFCNKRTNHDSIELANGNNQRKSFEVNSGLGRMVNRIRNSTRQKKGRLPSEHEQNGHVVETETGVHSHQEDDSE